MSPARRARRRSYRQLRTERLESRYALATYTVNTPGALLDADANDGVWDVDLQTPGIQLTLAAAAQAVNADGSGSGNVLVAIDGALSAATFDVPVAIDGQLHNVDLGGGELRLNQGGTVGNLKLANGSLTVSGDNASIQNNTIAYAGGFYALLVQGNTATIKNNVVSGGAVGVIGNGSTFQNNSTTGARIDVQGNNNVLLANAIYQSPSAGIALAGSNNRIESNQIGTDGTADLGNAGDGIRLVAAPGGSTGNLIVNNLIGGNGGYGVSIRDALSTSNRVEGNKIGTNSAGTAAIANSTGGVLIENAVNNTIGNTTAGTGNLISGNSGDGLRITGTTSTGNKILRNTIGLANGETAALPNGGNGITISGGQSNQIGDVSASNLIASNVGHGVLLTAGAKANLIRGNIIGSPNAVGLGNGGDGVRIENATENQLDGTGLINRISGNVGAGVRITGDTATKNVVAINVIGLNSAGTPLSNQQGGVTIENGANQNVIGGKGDKRNYISGNAQWGVAIRGASNNQVSGNFIGTVIDGNSSAGTQPIGVLIESGAQNNTIGIISTTHDPNLISGNTSHGVQIRGATTTNNTLAGNYIGRSASLQAIVANGGYNVLVSDQASLNKIGTAIAQQGQFIFGGGLGGVALIEGAAQNTIQNNLIDGGGGPGVLLDNAQNNFVGNSAFAFPNVIRNMQQAGVRLQGGSLGNRILGNSILANGELGISLESSLAQLPREAVIRQVVRNGTTLTFAYQAIGTPNTTVRVDFYANKTADASGFGEGELPLGSVDVVLGANGLSQVLTTNVVLADTSYTHFAVAMTDAAGTTYDFSRATSTAHVPSTAADLTVTTPTNDVQPIVLTVTFTSSGTPTGTVEFYDGDTLLGTTQVNANKQAGLIVFLAQGQHAVTALYKGAPTFAAAISTAITFNVVQGPPNVPPVANTDSPSVLEDASVVINVLANDTDPDGGTINPTTVVITQQPTHGTATVNAVTGAITYTPQINYDGPDTLRYTVKDNRNGTSNAGFVNITVTDIPEPWHRKASPLDVDGNGSITLTDVALVLSYLNALGAGPLPAPSATIQPPPYVDVDGDNVLTPTDVILVQNAVNAGAQAEWVEPPTEEAPPAAAAVVVPQDAENDDTTSTAGFPTSDTTAAAKVDDVGVTVSPLAETVWPADWAYYFAWDDYDRDRYATDGAAEVDWTAVDDLLAAWC